MNLTIWQYRHFIIASIAGEMRARYARSKLGLFWHVLHPLAQSVIFAIVLADVLGTKLPGLQDKSAYPLYLLSGMAAWNLFYDIVRQCLTMFIDQAGPLKKIAFPRICLPLIVLGNAMLNHALLLAAIVLVFAFYGRFPGVAWLALPLGMLLIASLAFGIGIVLGTINVFSRDIGQAVPIVLQLWFWVTPIVYPMNAVPERLHWLLAVNPMASLTDVYQGALVFDRFPDPVKLAFPALCACLLLGVSIFVFRRASSEIVDAL